jgi:hypothetical protein
MMIQKQDLVEFEELINGLLKKMAVHTETLLDPRYRVIKDDMAFICIFGMLEMMTKYNEKNTQGKEYKAFFSRLSKIIDNFKDTEVFNKYICTTTLLYTIARDAKEGTTPDELIDTVKGKFEAERKRSQK